MGEAAGGEEHAGAVVVAVAVAAGEAAVQFDDAVDRFGAAVVRATDGEVRAERSAPGAQRPAEAANSRIRQVWTVSTSFAAIRHPSARSFAW
jgi:hypothetical protein